MKRKQAIEGTMIFDGQRQSFYMAMPVKGKGNIPYCHEGLPDAFVLFDLFGRVEGKRVRITVEEVVDAGQPAD